MGGRKDIQSIDDAGAIKDFSNYLQNAKGRYERTLQNKRDRIGRKDTG